MGKIKASMAKTLQFDNKYLEKTPLSALLNPRHQQFILIMENILM